MATVKYDSETQGYSCARCGTEAQEGSRFCVCCGMPLLWERHSIDAALELVRAERERQESKWGEQSHPLSEWVCLLGEEFGEFCQAVNDFIFETGESGLEHIREEAIHAAAVAVQIVEKLDAQIVKEQKDGGAPSVTGGAGDSSLGEGAKPAGDGGMTPFHSRAAALPELDEAEPPEAELGSVQAEPAGAAPSIQQEGYKGFLFLRCERCGKERAFCAKRPIRDYYCADCGHTTQLGNLEVATLACKCGNQSRYKTNLVEQVIEVPCVNCGAPVPLEYRGGRYRTMGQGK